MKAQVRGLSSTLNGSMRGLGAGILGALSVSSVTGLLQHFGRLGDLADQLGATREEIQRMTGVANVNGTTIEVVGRMFTAATQKVREFQAGLATIGDEEADPKKLERALKALNLDANTFAGAGLQEKVLMLAAGMDSVADPTLAAGYALDILGNRGKELLPMLQLGAAELARQLGETAAVSDAAARKLEALDDRLDGLKNTMTAFAGDALLKVVGGFQMVASGALKAGSAIMWLQSKANPLSFVPGVGKWLGDTSTLLDNAANKLAEDASRNFDPAGWAEIDGPKAGKKTTDPKRAAEMQAAEQRKNFEEDIAKIRQKAGRDALGTEEKLIALRNDYNAAVAGKNFSTAKTLAEEIARIEVDASNKKRKAAEDVAELQRQIGEQDLSRTEKIAALREESLRKAAEGKYDESARAAKEMSQLFSEQTKAQESLAGGRGVVADNLRKVGLGGRAASTSVDQSMLTTAKSQLAKLAEIKAAIEAQGPRGETFK
jgi:hypothetical protein